MARPIPIEAHALGSMQLKLVLRNADDGRKLEIVNMCDGIPEGVTPIVDEAGSTVEISILGIDRIRHLPM